MVLPTNHPIIAGIVGKTPVTWWYTMALCKAPTIKNGGYQWILTNNTRAPMGILSLINDGTPGACPCLVGGPQGGRAPSPRSAVSALPRTWVRRARKRKPRKPGSVACHWRNQSMVAPMSGCGNEWSYSHNYQP